MKRIILSLALLCGAAGAMAQKAVTETIYINPEKELTIVNEKFEQWTDSVTVVKLERPFVYNRFWDNWFLQAGAGGQVYFGDQDNHGNFFNRVTPLFEFSLGKWLHPVYGFRAQAGGWQVKGYSTSPNAYTSGPMCEEGYYTQKWDQLYARADFMLNLSNAIGGYRYDRFYSAVPFVGLGAALTLNNNDKEGDFTNRSAVLAAGLLNTFRLCDNFDLFLEGKYSIVADDYDRQVTKDAYDGFLGVTAGVIWRIGKAGARPFRNEIVTKTYLTRLYKPEVTVVKEVVVEEKVVPRASADVLNTQIAVFFELNDATVTDRAKVNLQYAAEMIKNNPGQFRVVGMADSQTGSPALNQRLSERRAEAVRQILVKEHGVPESKLIVEALGGVAYKHPDYVNRAVIIMPEK